MWQRLMTNRFHSNSEWWSHDLSHSASAPAPPPHVSVPDKGCTQKCGEEIMIWQNLCITPPFQMNC